jgi:hypothetical protein
MGGLKMAQLHLSAITDDDVNVFLKRLTFYVEHHKCIGNINEFHPTHKMGQLQPNPFIKIPHNAVSFQ